MYIEIRIWRFAMKFQTGWIQKEQPAPPEPPAPAPEPRVSAGFQPNP